MSRLETLEIMTALVEAIKDYQRYKANLEQRRKDNLQSGFLDSNWYDHKIEIYSKVVERLELRYSQHLIKLIDNN